jgi:Uncharacterised protein family (UPF0149)
MLTAITTIVARFNAISQGLSTAPDRHAPIFRKTDDDQALPHLWCMGFLSGMRLRMDAWQPLLDLNRIDRGLLLPILLYCVDPSGQPMLGPPREGPEKEEFIRTAYHDIPLVIPAIRNFFMPKRVREANSQRRRGVRNSHRLRSWCSGASSTNSACATCPICFRFGGSSSVTRPSGTGSESSPHP